MTVESAKAKFNPDSDGHTSDGSNSDKPRVVFSTRKIACGTRETWFHWFTGANDLAEFYEWDTFACMTTKEKLAYIKNEVALGITICFAQVPESVAFAFMAHIKPPVAIHAAWVMGFICSAFGGRSAMVNGATGAAAAIIATFIPEPEKTGGNGEHIELLFPSVIMCGVFMLIIWAAGLYKFISLVPASVMIGFCNGLAIVIGNSQLHPFQEGHGDDKHWKTGEEFWWMALIMVSAMVVMETLPKIPLKFTKILPSSLIAILVSIVLEFALVRPLGARTDTIGDVEKFKLSYPYPFFLDDEYDLDLIEAKDIPKVLGQGLLLAIAGTTEGLLTTEVVYDFLKTPTQIPAVPLSCGVANMISGVMGGMGGGAMIGLSTLGCLSGGRGRLGPTVVSIGVALCMFSAYPLLNYIPMAALAGVMIVVVLHTFKWFSIPMVIAAFLPEKWRGRLGLPQKVDRFDTLIVVVVTVTVVMGNLVYGVALGLVMAGLRFDWYTSQDFQVEALKIEDTKIYLVKGRMFFGTAMRFHTCFDYEGDPGNVLIFLENAPVDYSAGATLGKVQSLYAAQEKEVTIHICAPSYLKVAPDESGVTATDVQGYLEEFQREELTLRGDSGDASDEHEWQKPRADPTVDAKQKILQDSTGQLASEPVAATMVASGERGDVKLVQL